MVDLPQPLGPMMEQNWWHGTSKLTLRTAQRAPSADVRDGKATPTFSSLSSD